MDFKSSELDGFDNWVDFSISGKKSLLGQLPTKKGVYVIRLLRYIERVNGRSDILYIGESKQGLKRRISKYFSPDETQTTNLKIKLFLDKPGERLQIAWEKCSDPKKRETSLLHSYFKRHFENPPMNFKASLNVEVLKDMGLDI